MSRKLILKCRPRGQPRTRRNPGPRRSEQPAQFSSARERAGIAGTSTGWISVVIRAWSAVATLYESRGHPGAMVANRTDTNPRAEFNCAFITGWHPAKSLMEDRVWWKQQSAAH